MSNLDAITRFMPDIRMRLHLDRLKPHSAHTSLVRIDDRERLGVVFSAYRRVGRRVETALDNPLSIPMTVAEVAGMLDTFSASNRAAFLDYCEKLKHEPVLPLWTLPAYDLGGGQLFLLDGNHRAVATYLSERPFKLDMLVLHAPVDRRILVSLKYWDGGLRRFWRRWRQAG